MDGPFIPQRNVKRADGTPVANSSLTTTPSTTPTQVPPSTTMPPQLKIDPALETTTQWTGGMIP